MNIKSLNIASKVSRFSSPWRSFELLSDLNPHRNQVWGHLGLPHKSTRKTEWAGLKMHRGPGKRTPKYWFQSPQLCSSGSYWVWMPKQSSWPVSWVVGSSLFGLGFNSNSENLGYIVKIRSPGHPSFADKTGQTQSPRRRLGSLKQTLSLS